MTPEVAVTSIRTTSVGINADVELRFGEATLGLRGLRLHRQPEGYVLTSAQIRVDDNLVVPCVVLPRAWKRAVIAAIEERLAA